MKTYLLSAVDGYEQKTVVLQSDTAFTAEQFEHICRQLIDNKLAPFIRLDDLVTKLTTICVFSRPELAHCEFWDDIPAEKGTYFSSGEGDL